MMLLSCRICRMTVGVLMAVLVLIALENVLMSLSLLLLVLFRRFLRFRLARRG